MWRRIPLLASQTSTQLGLRNFLSEAYKCTESWNARLATPVLQKVKPESFYYELEQQFQQQGRCSAIDIDIFANKLTGADYVEEVADLAHKLRLTAETTNTLDSTSHALIRIYLEHGQIKNLLEILNNRLHYGIFLDNFTANLALDTLIKAKDYTSGAKVAALLMLQENFSNDITRLLSLYTCVKFLQNPQSFEEVTPAIEEVATTPASKKKKEEVKVRVNFIRNEFFDDHFDLRDGHMLVGKTLVMIGKSLKGTIGNSAMLLGQFHFKRYSDAIQLLNTAGSAIHKDVVQSINEQLAAVTSEDENYLRFTETIKNTSSLNLLSENFEKAICDIANEAVAKTEPRDIDEQKKIYAEWCELRQVKLTEELERLNRAKRLAEVERKTKEMQSEEQKLWFFENEDNIDLQIDSKKVYYPKRWFGKKKKPRVIDEGYVPPEVTRKR